MFTSITEEIDMRIIIGEDSKKAMKRLNIGSYPFTYRELRDNYINLIKQYHPDVAECSKEKAEKESREIIYSYRLIENLAINIENISEDKARVIKELDKDDMFTFWEKCETCFGTGKIRRFINRRNGKRKEIVFDTCWKCKGVGKVKLDLFNPAIRKGAIL